jgi:two-component system, sporulation sensor kinase E
MSMDKPILTKESFEQQLVKNLEFMDVPCLLIDHLGEIIKSNQAYFSLFSDSQPSKKNAFSSLSKEFKSLAQFEQYFRNKETNPQLTWINHKKQLHTSKIQPIFIPYEQMYPAYAYIQFTTTYIPIHTLQSSFSEQLFSHSHLGFILLNEKAKVVKITEAAATILGGTAKDYIDQNILELFTSLPYDRQLVQKSFLEGVNVRNKAMSWNNGDLEFELLIDSFPIFDEHKKLIGVSVFIKDVTNIRSLENQIRRNDRLAMIGQIAAGTAHEIRNPLTSIKGFLQVLKTTLHNHEFIKEVDFANIMLEEVERINHLVGEFLLLSQSRETKYEEISLQKLMNQFVSIIKNEALLKGIQFTHQDFSGLPKVVGDQKLLKQVFLNICKNAIEAMGDQGKLKISHNLLKKERMISIDFEDTGPGIPPYVLDKIFDPFFTTKEEGTGLGLSVCQRIIHDMGGKIWVSSKGYTTIFHVQIPYDIEE